MGVSHPFCMGDWGLFVNVYYARMLNLATLKEVTSFHESMSLFGFFFLTETTELEASFIHP